MGGEKARGCGPGQYLGKGSALNVLHAHGIKLSLLLRLLLLLLHLEGVDGREAPGKSRPGPLLQRCQGVDARSPARQGAHETCWTEREGGGADYNPYIRRGSPPL